LKGAGGDIDKHYAMLNLKKTIDKRVLKYQGGEGMKVNIICKRAVVGLIAAMLLLAPGLAQAKGWGKYKEQKAKILKELKLSKDQHQKIQQIDEKCTKERKDIIKDLKKNQAELKKALAEKKPDEAKIKSLVGNVTGDQDKLMASFKDQRDAELNVMNPEQQGKYLLAMDKWYKEKRGKK
jgi:Spy/CpxP family protein refolding chaperone